MNDIRLVLLSRFRYRIAKQRRCEGTDEALKPSPAPSEVPIFW
jgi:hypothetical protein